MSGRTTHAPSAADIELIADREYHRIPEFLRARVDPVMIRVVDFPSEEVQEDMELTSVPRAPTTCSASIRARLRSIRRAGSTTCGKTWT